MNRKIDVYINGVYEFSTMQHKTCKEVKEQLRQVKRIKIASIPNRYLMIKDNDRITCRYSH